jgi:sec-independent protein translocase protein TatC
MARQSELDELRKEVQALRTGQGMVPLGAEADAAFREIRDDLNRPLDEPVMLAAPDEWPDSPPVMAPLEAEAAPAPKAKAKTAPKARKTTTKATAAPVASIKTASKPRPIRARRWTLSRLETDEDEIEASRAPLMDHLIELRGRLVICVVAFVIGFIGCFYFAEPLYIFLVKPFAAAAAFHQSVGPGGHVSPLDLILGTAGLKPLPGVDGQTVNLIYTAPLEILFTKMKLAGFGAIALMFPVLAYQVYRFVAPGLYKRERKAFLPFLLASPLLFMLGAALVYFVMLPFVLWFPVAADHRRRRLGGPVAQGVGLSEPGLPCCWPRPSFQLPVVMTLLGLAGIISSKVMAEGRRYAIMAVVVVAAVVTPPDPISQIMLAVPLVLLYEISIWCVRLIELRRKKADAAEAQASA